MLLFLGIFVITAGCLLTQLPAKLAEIAAPIHQACLEMAPRTSEIENYRAIVCGNPLGRTSNREAWAQSGLLHLLVVSGSHLIFIEQVLNFMVKRFRLRGSMVWPILLTFTAANLCQAPITRALIAYALQNLNRALQLRWSRVYVTTAAGGAAIAFCFSKADFVSLLLSWTASLAVSAFAPSPPGPVALLLHARVYLLLGPVLLPFSLPHPFSIACNAFLGPLLGAGLFPACLLAFAVPGLVHVTDLAWRAANGAIAQIAFHMPEGFEPLNIPMPVLIGYLIVLTLAARLEERRAE